MSLQRMFTGFFVSRGNPATGKIVSRSSLDRILEELMFQMSAFADQDSQLQIGKQLEIFKAPRGERVIICKLNTVWILIKSLSNLSKPKSGMPLVSISI